MIDLELGTKVRYKGKHGIVTKWGYYSECKDCLLYNSKHCDGEFVCTPWQRKDRTSIYVKEVK